MPPKRSKRKLAEDEVYVSRPLLKQTKLSKPRTKTIRRSTVREDTEPSKKRRRMQSTMTQLDFGRRSYLEVGNDDEEVSDGVRSEAWPRKRRSNRKSIFRERTESQHTLTQLHRQSSGGTRRVVGDSEEEDAGDDNIEDSDADYEIIKAPKVNTRKINPSRKLPTKSESQRTLTQYVRHSSSNLSRMVIGDSDDEEAGPLPSHDKENYSDGNGMSQKLAEDDICTSYAHNTTVTSHLSPQPEARPHDSEEAGSNPPHAVALFKTPKKKRMLPVPSSRSPPGSRLSTQPTPRQVKLSQRGTPSKHGMIDVSRVQINASQETSCKKAHSVVHSPFVIKASRYGSSSKESPIKIAAPSASASRCRSPLKEMSSNIRYTQVDTTQEPPSKSSAKKSDRYTESSAQSLPRDTGTQLRVRGFNEYWALLEEENMRRRSRPMLEQENTRLRSRQPLGMMSGSGFVLSSPPRAPIRSAETQYVTLGAETQAMLLELDVGDRQDAEFCDGDEQHEDVDEEIKFGEEHGTEHLEGIYDAEGQSEAEGSDERLGTANNPAAGADAVRNKTGKVREVINLIESEDDQSAPFSTPILIPSSQSKVEANFVAGNSTPASVPETIVHILDESWPSKSTRRLEKQMSSSEERLPERTADVGNACQIQGTKKNTQELASDQLYRETQAVVDRVPMSPTKPKDASSPFEPFHSRAPRPSQATTVDEMMPISTYHADLRATQSSPLIPSSQPPLIEDIELSSSPLPQPPKFSSEPGTPHHEGGTLRMSQLVSDSLDMSIPLPPDWGFEDGEDDDEL